jgi:hypothetical protein
LKRWISVVGLGLVWVFLGSAAQALTISSASVGNGRGCVDQACTNQTLTWQSNAGGGSGTLDIVGNTLSFSITLASTTLVAISGSDNGVTQLDFTSTTYTGTAALQPLGGGFYGILSGSATISGTQTPSGAGSAGGFAAADALLSGTCMDSGTSIGCGIVFGPSNDFSFLVNGATRHFTHTLNVTAVPEPATGALVGAALAGLGLAGRRRR